MLLWVISVICLKEGQRRRGYTCAQGYSRAMTQYVIHVRFWFDLDSCMYHRSEEKDMLIPHTRGHVHPTTPPLPQTAQLRPHDTRSRCTRGRCSCLAFFTHPCAQHDMAFQLFGPNFEALRAHAKQSCPTCVLGVCNRGVVHAPAGILPGPPPSLPLLKLPV